MSCSCWCCVQAMLIIGLLWQRARNRKADLSLRESEKRFRLVADTTPALIWMCDKEGTVTYLNDRRIDFTGRDLATGLGDVWSAFIHPDDVQSVKAANKRGLEQQQGYSKEYRLRRHDGVYRWMLDIAAPRVNEDGSFAGFVGSAVDITDQKLAHEALEKIGGKLIEAQEEERSRIARELHDDICQRLALLSMELEQANRGSNSGRSPKLEEKSGATVPKSPWMFRRCPTNSTPPSWSILVWRRPSGVTVANSLSSMM